MPTPTLTPTHPHPHPHTTTPTTPHPHHHTHTTTPTPPHPHHHIDTHALTLHSHLAQSCNCGGRLRLRQLPPATEVSRRVARVCADIRRGSDAKLPSLKQQLLGLRRGSSPSPKPNGDGSSPSPVPPVLTAGVSSGNADSAAQPWTHRSDDVTASFGDEVVDNRSGNGASAAGGNGNGRGNGGGSGRGGDTAPTRGSQEASAESSAPKRPPGSSGRPIVGTGAGMSRKQKFLSLV